MDNLAKATKLSRQLYALTKAVKLSRQIYASLPWGYRVAGLLLKLAHGAEETFGRFVYSKFIQAGVLGLPDVNGVPALSLKDKVQGPRGADKLPVGYGKKFGEKAWKICLAKFRNPEIVEDAVSSVMVKFVSGKLSVEEGVPLQKAEGFVLTALLNAGIDALRTKRRTPGGVSLVDEEDGSTFDISDPKSFEHLDDLLTPAQYEKLKKIVRQSDPINGPKAVDWMDAAMKGISKAELAAQWGLTPSTIVNFENRFLPKLQRIVKDFLGDAV